MTWTEAYQTARPMFFVIGLLAGFVFGPQILDWIRRQR